MKAKCLHVFFFDYDILYFSIAVKNLIFENTWLGLPNLSLNCSRRYEDHRKQPAQLSY